MAHNHWSEIMKNNQWPNLSYQSILSITFLTSIAETVLSKINFQTNPLEVFYQQKKQWLFYNNCYNYRRNLWNNVMSQY